MFAVMRRRDFRPLKEFNLLARKGRSRRGALLSFGPPSTLGEADAPGTLSAIILFAQIPAQSTANNIQTFLENHLSEMQHSAPTVDAAA